MMTAALSAWNFLKNGWRSIALALLAALAVQTARIDGFLWFDGYRQEVKTLRIDLEATRKLRMEERANHIATKANYRAAQLRAAQLEQARLRSVQRQQEEVSHDVMQNYQRDLAAARARYERLRRDPGQGGAGVAGAPGGERLPCLSAPAAGPAQEACDRGLSDAERLVATEQAIQLGSLIDWAEAQARIDPNRVLTEPPN